MKNYFYLLILVAACFVAITLCSCSVKAEISFSETGSQTEAVLKADPAVLKYWKDLAELDPKLPASPLEKEAFQKALEEKTKTTPPQIVQPSVIAPQAGTLNLKFLVPDWTSLQVGLPPLFNSRKTPEGTELTLRLDRKTFRQLTSLTTYGQSAALSSLIPEESAKVSTADYRDLLIYLLEPYDAKAAQSVDQSFVELKLNLPRAVKSAQGAISFKDKTVLCRWPLAQALALEKPLVVVVVY